MKHFIFCTGEIFIEKFNLSGKAELFKNWRKDFELHACLALQYFTKRRELERFMIFDMENDEFTSLHYFLSPFLFFRNTTVQWENKNAKLHNGILSRNETSDVLKYTSESVRFYETCGEILAEYSIEKL